MSIGVGCSLLLVIMVVLPVTSDINFINNIENTSHKYERTVNQSAIDHPCARFSRAVICYLDQMGYHAQAVNKSSKNWHHMWVAIQNPKDLGYVFIETLKGDGMGLVTSSKSYSTGNLVNLTRYDMVAHASLLKRWPEFK